jgi:hypothetical protein
MNGLAVYTPNPFRTIKFPLEAAARPAKLGEGQLKITFAAPEDQGGALLAETVMDLP